GASAFRRAERPLKPGAAEFCGRLLPVGWFRFLTRPSREGRAGCGIPPLALANERLDDLQRGARLALGASPAEIGRQLAIRAQDFLVPALALGGILVALRSFS